MDFPIADLLDQEARYAKLLALLHPDGLACPRCGARDGLKGRKRGRGGKGDGGGRKRGREVIIACVISIITSVPFSCLSISMTASPISR